MTGGKCRLVLFTGIEAAPAAPALLAGVELIGEYGGSGYREPPCLLRRSGRTIEISPLLFAVCASLDGNRTLAEVASIVSARSGRDATPADIAYLLEHKLAPLGVLADGPDGAAHPSLSPVLAVAARKSVLSISAVKRCTKPLRFLFLPPVMAGVLLAFAALDLWLLLVHGGLPLGDVANNPEYLVLLVLLTLTAGAFHELGHATACRYGGAEPGAIGVGLYLIWPVFYNDLDDSYRLDRAGRLRADLGGIYFNAVFILTLGSVYLATGFKPLLVAVTMQHLAILQQFIPFVRLDGYYVLSDVVGVPDLFSRIRPILSSLIPGRPTPPAVSQLKQRARVLVTAWVLITVPLLGGVVLFLVLQLPQLAAALWTTGSLRSYALITAWQDGEVWAVLLDGVQLVLVVVPPVGVLLTLGNLLRVLWASRRSPAPGLAG